MFVGRFVTSMDTECWQDERPDGDEAADLAINASLYFAPTRGSCIAKMVEQFKSELIEDAEENCCSNIVVERCDVDVDAGSCEIELSYVDSDEKAGHEQLMRFTVVECKA